MKIFIAGARAVKQLDFAVMSKLSSIYEKNYNVLVGDASGVDSAIQKFYADRMYNRVTVFASNGKARNNLGNWHVECIPVASNVKGFDFYRQKDIAMAESADYGFMIWDGQSKGTLHNIITLLAKGKTVCVYLVTHKRFFIVDSENKMMTLLSMSSLSANDIYSKFIKNQVHQLKQMPMF